MSKKISELKEAITVNDTDLLMIIQNGENKKIQASKIGTGQGGSGGGDTLPIGTIVPYGSDVIPGGWLRCDGSIVEQSDYPELFSVIGTTYGYYGRTDFKLPDLQGRVAVGKNTVIDTENPDTDFNELGKYGGKKEHTLTIDEMPSHTHKIQVRSGGIGDYYGDPPFTDANAGNLMDGGDTKSTGGSQPHNNLQPYLVTNYIIKAKMTVSIKGEIIQENGTASMDNVYSAVAVDNKIETLKRITLYEDENGSNVDITLNDSVDNYEDIEIFYKSNDNAYSSVKINKANNKNIILTNATPNSNNNVMYIKTTVVNAKNNIITVVDSLESYGSGGTTIGNNNYITKVVGYKEI